MGSRLKQNPEQTFHWFFEASCPVARDKDPGVLFQFPEDFSDEESYQTLPRFCFPYDVQRAREAVAVQHFTFVLTDLQGCQRFGFCRLTNSTHTCLCILSYLPWFEVFYKLLNNLADYLSKGQTSEVKALLTALYRQPLPLAAGSVTLQMGEQVLVSTEVSSPVGHPVEQEGVPYFIAPDPGSLPSIPENRNLTELIVAVDVGNLLQLYASMLFERRILIFASKLSTLTSCVHALSAVLYPMYWQHIFIPVLPPHLLDYCCAPTPYLIGVHSSLSEWVRSRELEEVVILNVDNNTLETPFDDFKRIPSDVMSGLKACLKRQAVSRGCGVSRAFLKAQALLFGGYRDALQSEQDEVSFSEELFLDHKSSSMKQFLQSAVHLQFFKQFIDSRLDVLNSGKEPQDLFEEEILRCEATAGRSKSYQQLVGNLKKGGGALILNMKSKANVRAKSLAKSGLKKLLHHKGSDGEPELQRGGSVSHRRAQSDCLQDRLPITHHYGMSRPRRPFSKSRAPRDKDNMKDTGDAWDGAVSSLATDPDSELREDEEEEEEEENALFSDSEEMDLLGEIFDSLSSRSSYDRGLLYGTRSLDLFGPDSHDYITKHGTANPSQESLALSISGSLHSWNLETTEELSDVTEDSDWLRPDSSVPEEGTDDVQAVCEEEERERGQRKGGVKWEEANGDQEELDQTNDLKEVNLGLSVQEKRGSLEDLALNGLMEKQEDEWLKDKKGNEHCVDEEGGEMEQKATEMQKQKPGEDGTEPTEKKSEEERGSVRNTHPAISAEEQPEAESATPCEPPSPAAAGPGEKSEDEEREMRQTPPPPKVQSAKARFQTQGPSQGVPINSRIKALAEPRRPSNASQSPEGEESNPPRDLEAASRSEASPDQDGRPPVKVSELKKRFEA
ncbi:DENN domain-containing protein 1B-like isoform X1 [Salarias fasciatus]|uniref:DENN domain-containing protein 1B-like isoform X1 n=1 Tax=Salarias fasciatus TaxID=181472 RepID=UPI001176B8D5|nr:DENN domain-containing protein 1B-like isoform X1 [Salarias fasciatus]XP_029950718.1 DENN domain-containing protein 1B-like isoform X1 [Salarias fasciatus]